MPVSHCRTLEALNLPAALEALERPVGLPPSLLQKAEEVRAEDGPARIEASIENVQKLAQQDMDILNEVGRCPQLSGTAYDTTSTQAMDILDQEAEEDETFRSESNVDRPPSHEANADLVAKAGRYRGILDQASESDGHVRQKWDEWQQNIVELTWDEVRPHDLLILGFHATHTAYERTNLRRLSRRRWYRSPARSRGPGLYRRRRTRAHCVCSWRL